LKELLKEYDTVLVNFTKSGNHESSFMKAAMASFKKKEVMQAPLHLIQCWTMMMTSVIDGDEFGMENGGWCCFMNSLPIIYLHKWLNENPNLTSFVSRQILPNVQLDTGNVNASKKWRASDGSVSAKSKKNAKKSPNEQVAEALIGYIKAKETAAVQPEKLVTRYV
jgi:hypothetical protein